MFDNIFIGIIAICGFTVIALLLLFCIVGLFALIADIFNFSFFDTCEEIMYKLLAGILFVFLIATVDGLAALLKVIYCSIVTGNL